MEQHIIDLLKISEKNFDNLYPSGSKLGIFYGVAKIDKVLEDGISNFCPILSAIGTRT